MMEQSLLIFDKAKLDFTLRRMCHQLIEHYGDFTNTVIIGIQPRGVHLSRRIHELLKKIVKGANIPYGELDVTFFRDDFRMHQNPLRPTLSNINFLIEGKKVILVDDVLYTGRTVRAAMDAMLAFGRAEKVELLVLVDRHREREVPIEAQYFGIRVDALESEKVIVRLKEGGHPDSVRIESNGG